VTDNYGSGAAQPPYDPQNPYASPQPGLAPGYGQQPYQEQQDAAQAASGQQLPYGPPPGYGPGPGYRQQPPYGQQQPYGPQPGYAPAPTYDQSQLYQAQPDAGQVPAYGQQQPYPGAVPPPYGQQQPFAGQAPYGQYGPVPLPAYLPPQRGGGRIGWLAAGVTLAAIILTVVVIVAVQPSSSTSGTPNNAPSGNAAPTAGSHTATEPAGLLSGKSGLTASACPGSGSGPWKLAQPSTVCGIPISQDADFNQIAQTELQGAELAFTDPGGFGNYTNGLAFQAMYPTFNSPGPYLSIQVFGFNGTFTNVNAAVKAIESDDFETFYTVPAGPHGGVMQCAEDTTDETQECVFGTSTTLGDIQFAFQNLSIPAGISADASAISVRDAIEVQS